MTTLTAKLFSLTKFAPYAKLACLGLALLATACGEASAMDLAQGGEVFDVPEVNVYVEDIRFADDPAPVMEDCMVCEPTEQGRSCMLTKCEASSVS